MAWAEPCGRGVATLCATAGLCAGRGAVRAAHLASAGVAAPRRLRAFQPGGRPPTRFAVRCAAPRSVGEVEGGPKQEGWVTVREDLLEQLLRTEAAHLANDQVRAVSMREVLDCLEPHRVAKFIHVEMPKRFAVRIRMIENLHGWSQVPELVQMHDMIQAWFRLLRLAPRGPEVGLKDFTEVIKTIRRQGKNTVPIVSAGMHKLRNLFKHEYSDPVVDKWLDDFLLLRIGGNMLIDQYIAIAKPEDGGFGKPYGIVDQQCDATEVCKQAAEYALALCEKFTGKTPVYSIETYVAGKHGPQYEEHCMFSYIPGYLRYVLLELLKNSFNATVKNAMDEADLKMRPVRILVCSDQRDCAIRISDLAGGIPFHVGDRIWSYMYGAAARGGSSSSAACDAHEAPKATPLAGYGVGLPLSRLHARYLGGHLRVASFPGYGTDAYLHLPIIEAHQVEEFPGAPKSKGPRVR